MSNKQITQQHHTTFESIKHSDAKDQEFWLARTLAKVLDCAQYRHLRIPRQFELDGVRVLNTVIINSI